MSLPAKLSQHGQRLITKGKIMKNLITSCSTIAVMFAGFGMVNSASAYDQHHLNQLARKIERQATQLITETVHYRHSAHYHEMIVETVKLRTAAIHVRAKTYCTRTFGELERELASLDHCFHEIEDFFDHVEDDAAFGRGHVHGNTAHVRVLLDRMEDTIHHMQDDVRALRRELYGHSRVIVSPRTVYKIPSPVYRSPYSGHGRSRIEIDNCRSDIRGGRRSGHSVHGVHGGSGLQINRGGFSLRIKL